MVVWENVLNMKEEAEAELMQGLSVPFACVGSGDPVRVLRLYTTNTLDIFWSIYWWGICTTCRYRFYCVVLKPYTLRLPTATATAGQLTSLCVCVRHWVWRWVWRWVSRTVLCGALYTACVDASRTVFWDRSLTWDPDCGPIGVLPLPHVTDYCI